MYDEQSLGADLQYDFCGFVLRAELLFNERPYRDPYRPKNEIGAFAADSDRLGYDGLVGYRIAKLSLMPYFLLEQYDFGEGEASRRSSTEVLRA